MSAETQELLRICEQLPEAKRVAVADFARFLLARNQDAPPHGAAARFGLGCRSADTAGAQGEAGLLRRAIA